jgi:phytoene dehydrogenase-like protein
MRIETSAKYDCVVVGAGPNGLASAIALAREGLSTLLVEAEDTAGGGARSLPLTIPGYLHDVCSSVHPLGLASPFFRTLGLEKHGLSWVHPPCALAHVLRDGTAVLVERSVDATAAQLGRDRGVYRRLIEPFVERFDELLPMILGPLGVPSSPLLLARFGLAGLRSMRGIAEARFSDPQGPAMLAGIAAHAMVPLEGRATASFGLVLAASAHAVGWPIARGGSQAITDALVSCFRELGGEVLTGHPVERLDQLPSARAYVLDVTPRQLLRMAGDRLSALYRARLGRFRYGPGVFKMDWALDGPIPWIDPACGRAATVHLSGDLDDVAATEAAVHSGRLLEQPFVILVQPTLFDPSRAPSGKHIAWAYCHVPHGSAVDASALIEGHIERFAPGFRDLVVARATKNAMQMEQYNANYVGGDINGGISDLGQLFFRPMARPDPYATGAPDVFLCSSSTPPGGGVHGMCGHHAARSVLARVFGRKPRELGETEPRRPGASFSRPAW